VGVLPSAVARELDENILQLLRTGRSSANQADKCNLYGKPPIPNPIFPVADISIFWYDLAAVIT